MFKILSVSCNYPRFSHFFTLQSCFSKVDVCLRHILSVLAIQKKRNHKADKCLRGKRSSELQQGPCRNGLFYLQQAGGLQKSLKLTNDGYWLPGKPDPPLEANIFTPAACRPQPDQVLSTKKHHQNYFLTE